MKTLPGITGLEYCTKGIGVHTRVDTIIQFPGYSQSCNGYSYCLNNPLKYADPGGYKYEEPFYDEPVNGLSTWSFDLWWRLKELKKDKDLTYLDVVGIAYNELDYYSIKLQRAIQNYYRFVAELFSVSRNTEAFKTMWVASYPINGTQLENNAWLTSKGVLVLPNFNNTADKCSFDYLPYFEKGGRWYVTFDNENLQIIGTFHTHPGGREFDYIDGWDIEKLRKFGPIFVLGDDHLYYSDGNTQRKLTSNETFLKYGLWGCGIPNF